MIRFSPGVDSDARLIYVSYRKVFRRIGFRLNSPILFLEVSVISKNDLMINEEIRDREVRVISNDGEPVGIMSPTAALDLAYSKNLDLVKIAPNAQPPVCKIMDYGKYVFDMAKRKRSS